MRNFYLRCKCRSEAFKILRKANTGLDREFTHLLQLHAAMWSCWTAAYLGATGLLSPWVGMETCNGWTDSLSKPVLAFKALSMIMIVVINKLSGTIIWCFSGIRLLPVHRTSLCSIGNLCAIEELSFWWKRRVRKLWHTAWWEETWKRLCRLEKNHLKCHSTCIQFTVKFDT